MEKVTLKMWHVNDKKWKKSNNKRNTTSKSRKNQRAWRKGKLQVPRIEEADTIKQAEMKNRKEYVR